MNDFHEGHVDFQVQLQQARLETVRQSATYNRPFSPDSEASLGNPKTLRGQILTKLGVLLGVDNPATVCVNIQAASLLENPRISDHSKNDRVTSMAVVRGYWPFTAESAWRQGARQVLLNTQKTLMAPQALSPEEAKKWSQVPLPQKFWQILKQFTRQKPPPISAREPGRVWKDFVALLPAETLRYCCDLDIGLSLSDPNHLAYLVHYFCRTHQEFSPAASAAGQPLGFVDVRPTKANRIIPCQPDKPFPFLFYSQPQGRQPLGRLIQLNASEAGFSPESVRSQLEASLQKPAQPLKNFSHQSILAAFCQDQVSEPGENMFSQAVIAPGFEAGQYHPWVVFYNSLDASGRLRLQAGVDHLACDGSLFAAFIDGYSRGKVEIPGILSRLDSPKAKIEPSPPDVPEDFAIEDYGQAVITRLPRPDIKAGADVLTYASLWANQIYISHLQQARGGLWNTLNRRPACNFTVSRDALKPLGAASCWLADPEDFPRESPFYDLRHVICLAPSLIGFKLGKDLASKGEKLPEAMRWMSLVAHTRYPDAFGKALLALNRSGPMTWLRNFLFPQTEIYENADGLAHTTVAGTDLPNGVWIDNGLSLTRVYSVDPQSRYFKSGELAPYAAWATQACGQLLGAIGQWQKNDGSLENLNQAIETVYQQERANLTKLYPTKKK